MSTGDYAPTNIRQDNDGEGNVDTSSTNIVDSGLTGYISKLALRGNLN